MKKVLILVFLMAVLALPHYAKFTGYEDFISTAISINASQTATNGSEFTSAEVEVSIPLNDPTPVALITLAYTRSGAGSTSTIDVHLQVYNGSAWTTADVYGFSVTSNTDNGGSGSNVKAAKFIYLYGVQRVRLYKIVNNDSGENLTNVNVTISF